MRQNPALDSTAVDKEDNQNACASHPQQIIFQKSEITVQGGILYLLS